MIRHLHQQNLRTFVGNTEIPRSSDFEVQSTRYGPLLHRCSLWTRVTDYFNRFARQKRIVDVEQALERARVRFQQHIDSHPLDDRERCLATRYNRVVKACNHLGLQALNMPDGDNAWYPTASHYLPPHDATAQRPHRRNGYFFNSPAETRWHHFADALNVARKTVGQVPEFLNTDATAWHRPNAPKARSIDPSVQWIGHATVLVQIGGMNILTDPIFWNMTMFYPRHSPAGVPFDHLPAIDAVVISHNHRDHLDATSLAALLSMQPLMLAPAGVGGWLREQGFEKVIENDWWTRTECSDGKGHSVDITFTPAVHWSKRGLADDHESLWGGWTFSANGRSVYFAGDTAYDQRMFKEIAKRTDPIDIALLPIGPVGPRAHQCGSHVDAKEAGAALLDLGAKTMVPIHWGTFALGSDQFLTPVDQLECWLQQQNDVAKKVHWLGFGERFSAGPAPEGLTRQDSARPSTPRTARPKPQSKGCSAAA